MTVPARLPVVALALASAAANAQGYPSRPIRMVVPFAPGGANDISARIVAPALSERMGQPWVVDNRPGAAGNIGLEIVARAQPDGHTVLVGNVSTNSINETLYPATLRARPSRDLAPVTLIASVPNLLVAGAGFPAGTLKDAIAYAKSRPGQLNYSSPLGGYSHLDMLDLNLKAGIRMVNVPSKGAGSSVTAIIAGEIHMSIMNAATSLPQVLGGRLKALATTAPRRLPELPDVPTFAEAGFPGTGSDIWIGLFVPSRTPRTIVELMHRTVVAVVQQPAVQAAYARAGVPALTSAAPAEFAKFVAAETERWALIIRQNDVKVE